MKFCYLKVSCVGCSRGYVPVVMQFSFVEIFRSSLAALVLWILWHFTRHMSGWEGKEKVVMKASFWRFERIYTIHLGILLVTWLGAGVCTWPGALLSGIWMGARSTDQGTAGRMAMQKLCEKHHLTDYSVFWGSLAHFPKSFAELEEEKQKWVSTHN